MPKRIDKLDWDKVHQLSLDVVNATIIENDPTYNFKNQILLDYLFELNEKYIHHPSILATIGDFLADEKERKLYYEKALKFAISQNNELEIEEITDSLKELSEMGS